MNTATVSNVGKNIQNYVEESRENPIVLVEGGEPVAILLSVSDKDDIERIALAHNPRFQKLINDADNRVKKTGGIKHDDFWESVGKAE